MGANVRDRIKARFRGHQETAKSAVIRCSAYGRRGIIPDDPLAEMRHALWQEMQYLLKYFEFVNEIEHTSNAWISTQREMYIATFQFMLDTWKPFLNAYNIGPAAGRLVSAIEETLGTVYRLVSKAAQMARDLINELLSEVRSLFNCFHARDEGYKQLDSDSLRQLVLEIAANGGQMPDTVVMSFAEAQSLNLFYDRDVQLKNSLKRHCMVVLGRCAEVAVRCAHLSLNAARASNSAKERIETLALDFLSCAKGPCVITPNLEAKRPPILEAHLSSTIDESRTPPIDADLAKREAGARGRPRASSHRLETPSTAPSSKAASLTRVAFA